MRKRLIALGVPARKVFEAGGVSADRPGGYGLKGRDAGVREILARVKAVAIRPTPLSGPQIPLSGDGRLSWGLASHEGPS